MGERRLTVVVIAAGKGTRMRSARPKILHTLCGRPLLGHVLAVADALAPITTTVVLSPDTLDVVRAAFGDRYRYAVQAEQFGTGHAVLQARPALSDTCGEVLVLYGDTPLLRYETAYALLELCRSSGALVGLVSFRSAAPAGYGRVLRDEADRVIALIEERNLTPAQRAIDEVNSGIMCFDATWLWATIDDIPLNPVKSEYYLTDLVAMAVAARGPGAVIALPASDPREAWGINDRLQLAQAEAVLRQRILDDLMHSGVTVTDPAATYVDVGVEVGRDTTLLPGTLLRGTTRLGAGCTIGPYATLVDSIVGDRASVSYALVERTHVPDDTTIGPFVHRDGA